MLLLLEELPLLLELLLQLLLLLLELQLLLPQELLLLQLLLLQLLLLLLQLLRSADTTTKGRLQLKPVLLLQKHSSKTHLSATLLFLSLPTADFPYLKTSPKSAGMAASRLLPSREPIRPMHSVKKTRTKCVRSRSKSVSKPRRRRSSISRNGNQRSISKQQ